MKKLSKAEKREERRRVAGETKTMKAIIGLLIGNIVVVGGFMLATQKIEPQAGVGVETKIEKQTGVRTETKMGLEMPVIEAGEININKAEVARAGYIFYPYKLEGVDMEVMAVKASDGTIRTAFNTCHECKGSGRGYFTVEDGELKCQNCGNKFNFDAVATVSGGCNPIALGHVHENAESILIEESVMSEGKEHFKNWKTK